MRSPYGSHTKLPFRSKLNNIPKSPILTQKSKETEKEEEGGEKKEALIDKNKVLKSPNLTQKSNQIPLNEDDEEIISALLMLRNQDPWKIKKRITESDRNSSSRLLISTRAVQEHLLPDMGPWRRREIESERGLIVRVKDCDTQDVFQLKFRWWPSSKSFVFNEGWRMEFVRRRELKNDDEIGLFWNRLDEMLMFSVLRRAD